MPRYCLLGHVDPSRLEEYREAHSAVWPELLEALRDAGWRNYSLFLRDDGLLIGYAEADDLASRRNGSPAPRSMLAGRRPWRNCSRPRVLPTKPGRSFRRCSTSKINFGDCRPGVGLKFRSRPQERCCASCQA